MKTKCLVLTVCEEIESLVFPADGSIIVTFLADNLEIT